ncbi:MAG TPA: rod shape-determining protein RodA [Clostridia bacterium]|nr:rod shape-determining protein RodA [Clostridia bacterium]
MYFVEKSKGISYIKQFDYFLFITVIIMTIVGIFVLDSATNTMDGSKNLLIKQIASIIIGITAALIISAIDYKDFKILGIIFYGISVLLLVYVMFKGTGETSWGSRSWISVPLVGRMQPSEFAKIAVVLVLSVYFEKIKESQGNKNVLKIFIFAAVPLAFVLKQPDYGTAMVFVFLIGVMIFISGIKYKYILGGIIAAIPASVFAWFFLLNEKRKDRIRVFFDPGSDASDSGYQVLQSIRTTGSGQVFGKGLFHGLQTQHGSVPERESDFIFTVIGEELGFIGSVIILILVFVLLMRCLYIAKNSRDPFGSFLVIGLTSMMAIHYIESIGMCIGIMPVTGIPLPFISKGGSAMVTNYIAIGIILSVSMRRKKAIFNTT